MSDDAADPPEALFLEEPEQLRLQPRRHLADFVQEDRSAVGRLEQSLLLHARVRERPALVSEQLALEELFRERRARDVHERLRRSVACVMNDLRDEILAGSALARQQDGRCRTHCNARDQMPQRKNRWRGPDDPLQAVWPRRIAAELPHLSPQPGRLQRALDRRRHVVEVERLVGEVVRAELHRFDRGLDRGVRREQNHQDVGIELLHLSQNRDAVGVWKAVIEQHEVHAFGEFFERGASGIGFEQIVSVGLQTFRQRPPDERFVVDDQNRGFGHGVRILRGDAPAGCRSSAARIRRFRPDSDRDLRRVGNYPRLCGKFRTMQEKTSDRTPTALHHTAGQ